MEQVLWNHGKTLTFNLEDALYTQASESLMWGGLYGLSQSKIKGRWNPYIYNNQKGYSIERNTWQKTVQYFWGLPEEPVNKYVYINDDGTLKTTVVIDGVERTQNLTDNVDYIRIYIPCEEDIGYVYIKPEIGTLKYGELTGGIKITRNNRDVLIWSPEQNNKQSINIYDRDYFANELLNNMESCELQINNFEAFENNIIKAEEHEDNRPVLDPTDPYITTFNTITSGLNYINQYVNFYISHNFSGTPESHEAEITIFPNYLRFVHVKTTTLYGHTYITHSTYDMITSYNKLSYVMNNNNKVVDIINENGDSIKDWSSAVYQTFYLYQVYENGEEVGAGSGGHSIENFLDDLVNAQLTEGEFLYDTNIDWGNREIEIPLHDIHEYKWKNCNVSLLSSAGYFNNIVTMDNVDICYQTIDFNSNKRFLFYSDIDKRWNSYKFLSTKVNIRLTNIDGDEGTLTSNIPLGIFYIVEDENLVTPTESNFINPIETSIQNRKIMENIIPLIAEKKFAIDVDKNIKSFNYSQLPEYNKTALTVFYNPDTMKPYEPNEYYLENSKGERTFGNYKVFNIGERYLKWVRRIADYGTAIGQTINLNRSNFPYNFKLIGETYIRDRYSEDSHYQIELYNCAILDSINLNLSASGEPNTVNIKMKALTDANGDVGRLTIYNYDINKENNSVPAQGIFKEEQKLYTSFDVLEELPHILVSQGYEIRILHPNPYTLFCMDQDCAVPTRAASGSTKTYLRLVTPEDESSYKNKNCATYYEEIKDQLEKEDLLIAKVDSRERIKGFVSRKDINTLKFLNEQEVI